MVFLIIISVANCVTLGMPYHSNTFSIDRSPAKQLSFLFQYLLFADREIGFGTHSGQETGIFSKLDPLNCHEEINSTIYLYNYFTDFNIEFILTFFRKKLYCIFTEGGIK